MGGSQDITHVKAGRKCETEKSGQKREIAKMQRPETTRISPIPIVHKRSQATIPSSGGYYSKKSTLKYSANEIPQGLLVIDPLEKYHYQEGFGLPAPGRKITQIPPLVAHNAQFVRPPEPEPIPVEHQETQTEEAPLYKKELESLHEYQEWIAQKVDPLLKDLRLALIQSKPEDVGEFLRAYGISISTNSEPPRTVERDNYLG